jgi:ATP-dependent Clp protease ATP-binding subunit ClpA
LAKLLDRAGIEHCVRPAPVRALADAEAVGMDGTIMQSADGGRTWKAYESPVQTALYNVVIDGQTGWAVGDEGVILNSTDGGKNWTLVDAPEELALYWMMGVSLAPGPHGVITGSNGLVLTTAGNKVDFEARFKALIAALRERENPILFIDEVHTILGAGAAQGATVDASNLLKPLLQSGELRFMGSTTYQEFRHFERDRALSRRFQKVDVREPSSDEAVRILQGLAPRYEEHHGVHFTAPALRAAVDLSVRHLTDRFLPDKAIDVMDEAGAAVRLRPLGKARKTVGVRDVEDVIARIANIPATRASLSDRERLEKLEAELRKTVFGQDAAITSVVRAVKRARAGLGGVDRPIGCFLFTGPTGVGKTELSKQLAKALGVPFVRFDMSEYMEKHAVAKLIGAPPGYEGFDAGGILTNSMRKNPRRVCLFDEIEKGHPGVFDVFMQVLSDGRLTDSLGRTVDFSNAYIGFTTNIGQTHFLDTTLSDEQAEALAVEELKKSYRSEFLNRFAGRQNILCYKRLGVGAIEKIVAREIKSINENYGEQGITVNVTPQDVKAFCQAKYDPTSGARGLPGYLQANLEPIIVNSLLEHPERRGVVNFRYDAAAGDFVAAFEPLKDAA